MSETGLLVCTRKGLLVGRSDTERREWDWSPLAFGGWQADYAVYDDRSDTIWAAVSHAQWGPRLHRSDDGGRNWDQVTTPRFDDGEASLESIWTITPGGVNGNLYAGVMPAALFASHDDGGSWELCRPLAETPSRVDWMEGAAGLMFHSVFVDPQDEQRIFVAGSATGMYATEDGGATWEPRNGGVRNEVMPPDWEGEAGHCVHSFFAHPGQRGRLWQQNHFGQYRSDDGGRSWTEIGQGLPGDFGFAMAIDPSDPDAAWYVPLDFDQMRMPRGGALAVYRTRDAGRSWTALRDGLPQQDFHQSVYRQALGTDGLDPLGLYLGSSGGELYGSRDGGDRWTRLREHLAAITAVRAYAR